MATTIQIDNKVKSRLDLLKIHRRETYNELISRMMEKCEPTLDNESLIETIEVLSDPVAMKNIAEALESLENGTFRGIPLEQIEKELGL